VKAAVESTRRYLDFLEEQECGLQTYTAAGVQGREEGLFFQNSRWSTYECRLPAPLRIPSDSSATFIRETAPGERIEIRILDYDRMSGDTAFAARFDGIGETGKIVIDFRWLIQRCLDWFQNRGISISEVLAIKGDIGEGEAPFDKLDGLSERQAAAVRMILDSGLSYVWGPPGTGKTNWVLANAVFECVKRGERVLVLAPTNLAVDNALTAVLHRGLMARDGVARIGIPSPRFVEAFPQCCEQRAFQHEVKQIEAQVAALQERIASVERAREVDIQILEDGASLKALDGFRQDTEEQIARVKADLRRHREAVRCAQQDLDELESQAAAKRTELQSLSFPQLVRDIETLEGEQTGAIERMSEHREALLGLGFLARVFTRRKQRLEDLLRKEGSHLESVESTLGTKRLKRETLEPRVRVLDSEIARQTTLSQEGRDRVAVLRASTSGIENEERELVAAIAGMRADRREIAVRLERNRKAREGLGSDPPLDEADQRLAEWHEKIERYRQQLEQFRLDLAQKQVLGMTLDGFIGMTLDMGISADRVFIDEAPYAPLAKVLPLLSLGCPIAMLGDHRQLPPVCQCKNDELVRAFWAKPSILLGDTFQLSEEFTEPNQLLTRLNQLQDPDWGLTCRCILTDSYRFGPYLADLLDRHVYEIGLTGLAAEDTCVRYIDCSPHERAGRTKRQNDAEADRIVSKLASWWDWAKEQPECPTIAILTPYKPQVALIRAKLRNRFGNSEISNHVEVWNTHQAQGREWDWVLFSVSDTGNLEGNGPWFSDSSKREGRALLNTTISRTKKHLRVFLDAEWWNQRHHTAPSILTELTCLRDARE